jgi:hypothetical protein
MFIGVMGLVSLSLWANQTVQVNETHYNAEKDLLEVKISYRGGCIEHQFSMQLVGCVLSKTDHIGLMNICDAEITDVTTEEDQCKSIVTRTLQVSLRGLSAEVRPSLIGFNQTNVVFVSNKG